MMEYIFLVSENLFQRERGHLAVFLHGFQVNLVLVAEDHHHALLPLDVGLVEIHHIVEGHLLDGVVVFLVR